MNREFLMALSTYESGGRNGWLWSEKLDGQRCFWDGGVSRGRLKSEVPWANVVKDSRYKVAPVATGLWSRYGNVICAPDWFLDRLPEGVLLDGELWMGRRRFNETRSVVSRLDGGDEWKGVRYHVFDIPSPFQFCGSGKINKGANWKEFVFPAREAVAWFDMKPLVWFQDVGKQLNKYENEIVRPVPQMEVFGSVGAILDDVLGEIPDAEGIVIRRPDSYWQARRVDFCQKVLRVRMDEAAVIGWKYGTGKYEGMVGAIQVAGEVDGRSVTFWLNIRGDELRVPSAWPNGKLVRYEYMEITPDGKPRNPRIADV